jgi:putative restriction endonuclease
MRGRFVQGCLAPWDSSPVLGDCTSVLVNTIAHMATSERVFGEIEGVKPGAWFVDRQAAHDACVHRPLEAGICGGKKDGAESIVVSGGYPDDFDGDDYIVYTGHGGQDPTSKRQIADQNLDDSGNRALTVSMREGLPVRVIRGSKGDRAYSPPSGYVYSGLFRVADYWRDRGVEGFMMVMFRLEQIRDPLELDHEAAEQSLSETQRRGAFVQRIVRNTKVAAKVKAWHNYTCQVCGVRIETPAGPYAEGAHIRALGTPHDGPDREDNLLCLCPNCHVLFDAGAITVDSSDLGIWERGERRGTLRTKPRHLVDREQFDYHQKVHRGFA